MEIFPKKSGKGYETVDDSSPADEKAKKSSLIARIANAPKRLIKRLQGKDVEYILGDDGQPKTQATVALTAADDFLTKEQEFFRQKKNAAILSNIDQRLWREEKEENPAALDDKLLNHFEHQAEEQDVRLELENSKGLVALDSDGADDDEAYLDESPQGKETKAIGKRAQEAFARMRGLLSSKGGETAQEMTEKANDFADIGATCAELAHKLAELSDKAHSLAEAGGHAGNAASAAPIVGAVISLLLLAKDCKELSSVWRRMAKQHQIKGLLKDPAEGDEAPEAGLDAALRCVRDVQAQHRNVVAADILWQATTSAGHLASMTGVGALAGIPVAICGAVASSLTKVVATGLEYKEAHDFHKAAKSRTQDGLEDALAAKEIRNNPRMAAQILINEAKNGGTQGALVCEFLKTFGVKDDLIDGIFSDDEADKAFENNKTIRLKVLHKLDRDDEDPKRIQEDLKDAGKAVKSYVPSPRKMKSLRDLRDAKNLLIKNGMGDRNTGWIMKHTFANPDPEKEKAQLLAAIKQGLADGKLEETDDLKLAMAYLQPHKDAGYEIV